MFIVGMFCRRATGRVILPAVLITQFLSFVYSWWGEIPWLCERLGLHGLAALWPRILGVYPDGRLRTPTIMLAILIPCLVGIGLGWLLSVPLGRREHPGLAYTWRAVLSRSSENV
jgi:hypothetical protein